MNPKLRNYLVIAAGVAAAVVAGWEIANESYFLVVLLGGMFLLALGRSVTGVPVDALVGGVVLVGYLIGNRGFAQLHAPGLPLLPGEAALALAAAMVLWRAARSNTLPIRRDALSMLVLAWVAVGAIRIPFDFRTYGFLAIRDFAIVYYAIFFFIAQTWAIDPAARKWLLRCLALGLALSGPVFVLFDRNQEWFMSNLTVAGTPLIYVKSDVAAGFMSSAVIWFALRRVRTRQTRWLIISAIALFSVGISNSRAAIVALLTGLGWLAVLRVWKALLPITAIAMVGLAGLGLEAALSSRPIASTPIYQLYERGASILDLSGTRTYRASDLDDKPDNNQFRLVWWRTIIDATRNEGAWFGLGFGRDLAAEFLRVYYADANEDFSARSPHNFLLTIFGRTGLIGFLGLLAILVAMMENTWRAARREMNESDRDSPLALWLTSWSVFVAACFGVVLEGPMAAMVFWTSLGLANASISRPVTSEPAVNEEQSALPSAEASPQAIAHS